MIEEPIPEVEPLDNSLNESVESSSSDCRAEDNRWKKVVIAIALLPANEMF